MAFNQKSFGPISSHGNSDMPNIWTYSTQDNSADLLSDDYFIKKHPLINDGDLIYAQPSDSPLFGKFRKTAGGYTVDPLVGPGSVIGNQISITKVEDFDQFDDDTVILTDGMTYSVSGHVDIGARCILYNGSIVLKSNNTTDNSITSSCPTAMITGDGSFKLWSLSLISTIAPIYDITNTLPALIVLDSAVHIGAMGQITGVTGSVLFALLGSFDSVGTLTLNGAWTRIDLDNIFPRGALIESGETMITFSSTIEVSERILINDGYFPIDIGGVAFQFDSVANLGNESIQISNNNFTGGGSPVVGADSEINEAFYKANAGLIDSIANASWSVESNLLETTFTIINDPQPVASDNSTAGSSIQRFTFNDIDKTLTYTGSRERAFQVSATLVMETTSNNQRVGAILYINNIATNIAFTTTTSGSGGNRVDNLTISGVVGIDPGDVLQIRVFNLTSTDGILVTDMIFQTVALT